MYIGQKIKALRKEQNMTLSALAEKTGIQIATLSRMEHSLMSGTLKSHIKIAKALHTDLIELYSDITENPNSLPQTIDESSADVFTYNEKASYDLLTKNILSKKMLPTLIKIEPKGITSKEKNPIGTEKFIYVLSGKVNLTIKGYKSYLLKKDHSLYFKASTEHFYSNPGKTLTKIICVTTPVTL